MAFVEQKPQKRHQYRVRLNTRFHEAFRNTLGEILHWAPMHGHHYFSFPETPEVPLSLTLPRVPKSDDTCLLSGGHHVNLSPAHCLISHSPPSSAAARFAVGFPRLTFRQCVHADLEREGEREAGRPEPELEQRDGISASLTFKRWHDFR